MNLSTSAAVQPDVAMAAAVLFKNEVKKRWSEAAVGVSDGEKAAIRQHIISVACGGPPQLQSVYREAMRRICVEDYPDRWPSALEECGARYAAATFANPVSFVAPLQCLLLLAKTFQYRPDNERQPVETLCAAISPTLLQTLQLSLQQQPAPVIADIQIIVSKIFWSLTMFSLPSYFRTIDTFGVWIQATLALSSFEPPPLNRRHAPGRRRLEHVGPPPPPPLLLPPSHLRTPPPPPPQFLVAPAQAHHRHPRPSLPQSHCTL